MPAVAPAEPEAPVMPVAPAVPGWSGSGWNDAGTESPGSPAPKETRDHENGFGPEFGDASFSTVGRQRAGTMRLLPPELLTSTLEVLRPRVEAGASGSTTRKLPPVGFLANSPRNNMSRRPIKV